MIGCWSTRYWCVGALFVAAGSIEHVVSTNWVSRRACTDINRPNTMTSWHHLPNQPLLQVTALTWWPCQQGNWPCHNADHFTMLTIHHADPVAMLTLPCTMLTLSQCWPFHHADPVTVLPFPQCWPLHHADRTNPATFCRNADHFTMLTLSLYCHCHNAGHFTMLTISSCWPFHHADHFTMLTLSPYCHCHNADHFTMLTVFILITNLTLSPCWPLYHANFYTVPSPKPTEILRIFSQGS